MERTEMRCFSRDYWRWKLVSCKIGIGSRGTAAVKIEVRPVRVLLRHHCTAALLILLAGPAAADPVTIKILQVNDWDRIQESDGRGGYARFVSVLKQENAAASDVLLVHAGDAISPSLLSGFDKGAHMVELLNRVPLDVFVLGNHEFDFGPDVAKERIGEAKCPVLNSNVTERDGSLLARTIESRMIEVQGYKLGFFGLTTPETSFLSSPGYAGFKPLIETARHDGEAAQCGGRSGRDRLPHRLRR
jgi:5'-nucleotidase / UDP-sugar diphosphatase